MVLEVSARIAVVVLENAAAVARVVGQSSVVAGVWPALEAPVSTAQLDVVVVATPNRGSPSPGPATVVSIQL